MSPPDAKTKSRYGTVFISSVLCTGYTFKTCSTKPVLHILYLGRDVMRVSVKIVNNI